MIIVNTKKASRDQKGLGITISSSITFDKVAVFPKFQKNMEGVRISFQEVIRMLRDFIRSLLLSLAQMVILSGFFNLSTLFPFISLTKAVALDFKRVLMSILKTSMILPLMGMTNIFLLMDMETTKTNCISEIGTVGIAGIQNILEKAVCGKLEMIPWIF
ncbi:MAG: hypothetical protein IPM92_17005 [Saprospiraceae bacterium]|nr:hypothetical protein [Saprospiraceae bacterium]